MLRTALRSVLAQSARDKIDVVVVSENGGAKESEEVCNEFPGLPIHYVFREPALQPIDHGRVLLSEGSRTAFAAILHDDDWWSPHHLEAALAAFEANPEAAAYYSSFFEVSGESAILQCDHNFAFWFGAGFPALTSNWRMGSEQVLLSCLLRTPGRYSALVARTEALRRASAAVYATGNPFDNDRMLTMQLSTEGPLLCNPVPGAFIRTHDSQDSRSYGQEEQVARLSKTTDWLIQTAGKELVWLARRFANTADQCPADARHLQDWIFQTSPNVAYMASLPEMREILLPVLGKSKVWKSRIKDLIRQLVPPIVYRLKPLSR